MIQEPEPKSNLEELTEEECWALLAGQVVGRLAVVDQGSPVVLPVNYALDSHGISVRTGPGTKLSNASLDRVAFEVDQFNSGRQVGWSVLVQGVGIDATDAIDPASYRKHTSPPEPWVGGSKPNRIRIVQPRISGRRILRAGDGRSPELMDLVGRPPALPTGGTLREAAALMEDHMVSCIPVGQHSPPWIVTEHDLAGALCAGMGPDEPAEPLATRAPVWATPTTTVHGAVEAMVHHGVRHLVVLGTDGRLAGILSLPRAVSALLGADG
ncbi:MAG TPA: pyridoxamine 5'-phosphate oxidase family protein [Acidimicrobiales bacterium]|nr:pyridoxamine 5'-phosphate oxidase family protein [Acidimicrobiales bacterium]